MTLETSWSCSSPPSPPWRCCRQRRRRWPWTGSRSSSCSGRDAEHTCSTTAIRWDHRHWGGEEEQGENIKVTMSTTFLLQVLLQESLLGHGIGLKMNMFLMRMNSYNLMNWWCWTWGTQRKNSPIALAHLATWTKVWHWLMLRSKSDNICLDISPYFCKIFVEYFSTNMAKISEY